MSLISLIVILIIIGVLLYCVNQFIPMQSQVKQILNIVVIIFIIIWLLNVFGLLPISGGPSTNDLKVR